MPFGLSTQPPSGGGRTGRAGTSKCLSATFRSVLSRSFDRCHMREEGSGSGGRQHGGIVISTFSDAGGHMHVALARCVSDQLHCEKRARTSTLASAYSSRTNPARASLHPSAVMLMRPL